LLAGIDSASLEDRGGTSAASMRARLPVLRTVHLHIADAQCDPPSKTIFKFVDKGGG
jgi:hypothetical protein